MNKSDRDLSLDLLRVLAAYMVVQLDAGGFFYVGQMGRVIDGPSLAIMGWLNSLFWASVPLFVMLSG